MSDPVIVGAIVAGATTALAALLQFRTGKSATAVTGYAALTKDLQTERKEGRDEIDRLEAVITRLDASVTLLTAQLAEARAHIAQLQAVAAARTAGDLIVDNAIGDQP